MNNTNTIFIWITTHHSPPLKHNDFIQWKQHVLAILSVENVQEYFGNTFYPFPLFRKDYDDN